MKKIIKLGKTSNGALYLFVEIEDKIKKGEPVGKTLSITGVDGPTRDGNSRGSCGQCDDAIDDLKSIDPAFTHNSIAEIKSIWARWHLNDLKAGSPVQEEYLRNNPVYSTYPESHYDKASQALASAGLNPDKDGYMYGHDWRFEPLPDSVSAWFDRLPENGKDCPTVWKH